MGCNNAGIIISFGGPGDTDKYPTPSTGSLPSGLSTTWAVKEMNWPFVLSAIDGRPIPLLRGAQPLDNQLSEFRQLGKAIVWNVLQPALLLERLHEFIETVLKEAAVYQVGIECGNVVRSGGGPSGPPISNKHGQVIPNVFLVDSGGNCCSAIP